MRKVISRRAGHLLAITAMVALLLPAPTAAAKSFELTSLRTTAVVAADASMRVTEVITYDFDGGPFAIGDRTFATARDRVVDVSVRDRDGALVVRPTSRGFEWSFRAPITDQTITFTIEYVVRDAVTVGSDVGELYWQFLGDEHPGVGQVDITVSTPGAIPPATPATGPTDASVLRAWAHGPRNGEVRVSTSAATATVTDVPARTFVELRLAIPASAFAGPATSGPRLAGILADEDRAPDEADDIAGRRRLGWVLAPIVGVGGLAGVAWLWFAHGREPKSTEPIGDYWREPLDDPPAVAAATLRRGTVAPATAMAATILDLAQRGSIRIDAERVDRLGPDRTVHTYTWLGRPLPPDAPTHQRALVELLFRGRTTVTSDELTEWATGNRREAKAQLDRFTSALRSDYRAHRYDARLPVVPTLALVAISGACIAGGIVIASALRNGIGVAVAVLGGLLLLAGLALLRNRTPVGAAAAARARGLRNYLKDFSELDEAPVGHLILWERYLVFAVALGVSGELIRGLSARLPQVLADPQFGTWYVGGVGAGRFDHLGGVAQGMSSAVSAATPKSSGSGGGFSGGGGGGGGGGGFGAR